MKNYYIKQVDVKVDIRHNGRIKNKYIAVGLILECGNMLVDGGHVPGLLIDKNKNVQGAWLFRALAAREGAISDFLFGKYVGHG